MGQQIAPSRADIPAADVQLEQERTPSDVDEEPLYKVVDGERRKVDRMGTCLEFALPS